jgi:hypothetical protein
MLNIYSMARISNFSKFLNENLSLSSKEVSLLDECVKGVWEEENGVINVNGDFLASKKIPGKTLDTLVFGEVSGVFDISDNGLESLKGCPREVEEFNCSGNLLTTLSGGPDKAADYLCANNYLITLDGISNNAQNISAPGNSIESISALGGRPIKGNLFLNNNYLTSLDGCPEEIGGSLDLSECNINSLEGCAKKVSGNFDCSENHLTSLKGGPEFVGGYYDCGKNNLTSLEGIASNRLKWIDASDNQIYSVIDMPLGLVNAKVGLNKNALPLEILRSQQEFIEDSGKITFKDWFLSTLEKEKEQRYSPLPRMLEMFNDQKRKEAVEQFIEMSEIPEISNESPKKLAPIASGINPDSPFMNYVRNNKNLFSEEFLDSLEISTDLKDLGF